MGRLHLYTCDALVEHECRWGFTTGFCSARHSVFSMYRKILSRRDAARDNPLCVFLLRFCRCRCDRSLRHSEDLLLALVPHRGHRSEMLKLLVIAPACAEPCRMRAARFVLAAMGFARPCVQWIRGQ